MDTQTHSTGDRQEAVVADEHDVEDGRGAEQIVHHQPQLAEASAKGPAAGQHVGHIQRDAEGPCGRAGPWWAVAAGGPGSDPPQCRDAQDLRGHHLSGTSTPHLTHRLRPSLRHTLCPAARLETLPRPSSTSVPWTWGGEGRSCVGTFGRNEPLSLDSVQPSPSPTGERRRIASLLPRARWTPFPILALISLSSSPQKPRQPFS